MSEPKWVQVGCYEVYVWQGTDEKQRAEMQFAGWRRLGRPKCASIRVKKTHPLTAGQGEAT